ncbi:MAG: decaprenyl-phosphate phosphoribosyltransferase [Saccharofermentanales bacterium]
MRIITFFQLLRPHQWLKNLILLFPPFLGGTIFLPGVLAKGMVPFVSFCLASSASYVVNDLLDRENDLNHPDKQNRAIASGAVSPRQAIALAAFLLAASVALSFFVSYAFLGWLLVYLGLSFAYSFGLKDQPVFDIFCIASGFVFRLFAGGAAFDVRVSDWLFLSVLLLALFLSAGKRLSEKTLLGIDSGDHRKALNGYPPGVLESFMYISGAAVLVTYTMYVITKHKLVFTVPLCCFGLFRYLMIVKRGGSGDPTHSLLKDPLLFVVGLVWVVMVSFTIYINI